MGLLECLFFLAPYAMYAPFCAEDILFPLVGLESGAGAGRAAHATFSRAFERTAWCGAHLWSRIAI